MVKVSVIIPTRKIDDDVLRCVSHCQKLNPHEIIVIPDSICPGLPSGKRNYAMQRATGDVFAFIDSDAFPSPDWLKNALYWLQCFPAVCGPGVLPPESPFIEKVADQVHKWVFCKYRVMRMKPRIVPWHPTFNLVVKREFATDFDNYLTGEDDKFCERIPGGVFYHPDILVYHNRRGIFRPLWKQFGTYARHKGCFVGMAFFGWISTLWVYATNWILGFFRRKP